MLFVIPAKEILAEGSGILYGAEPVGELWAILECFELRFRVWIIVAHVWPAVGFGYAQITEKVGNHF